MIDTLIHALTTIGANTSVWSILLLTILTLCITSYWTHRVKIHGSAGFFVTSILSQ